MTHDNVQCLRNREKINALSSCKTDENGRRNKSPLLLMVKTPFFPNSHPPLPEWLRKVCAERVLLELPPRRRARLGPPNESKREKRDLYLRREASPPNQPKRIPKGQVAHQKSGIVSRR